MGVYVSVTLGRVARAEPRPDSADTPMTCPELGLTDVQFNQLEFLNYDEATDSDDPVEREELTKRTLVRGMLMFEMLGYDGSHIDSMLGERLKGRIATTSHVIEFLSKEYLNYKHRSPYAPTFRELYNLEYSYDLVGYTIAELTSFDYDQLVVPRGQLEMEADDRYVAGRAAAVQGKTYRDILRTDPEWWEFLKWAVENKWEFAFFNFH